MQEKLEKLVVLTTFKKVCTFSGRGSIKKSICSLFWWVPSLCLCSGLWWCLYCCCFTCWCGSSWSILIKLLVIEMSDDNNDMSNVKVFALDACSSWQSRFPISVDWFEHSNPVNWNVKWMYTWLFNSLMRIAPNYVQTPLRLPEFVLMGQWGSLYSSHYSHYLINEQDGISKQGGRFLHYEKWIR